MGRGRRGARSSDDEDDGVSPAPRGVQSSQVSGGGRAGKKWQPGTSGSQQKARAKEQRLEQERRKAERERRNEDKRAERDRLHQTEAHRDTPPKSAGKHRRSRVDEGSSSPAVGTPSTPRTSTPPTTWTPPACAASFAASSAASNTAAASLLSPAASSSSTTSSSSSASRRWRSDARAAPARGPSDSRGRRARRLPLRLPRHERRPRRRRIPLRLLLFPNLRTRRGLAGTAASAPEPPLPSRRARRRATAEASTTTTSIDATIETPWRKRLCGRITREDPP